jgi:hypothetical protein
MEWQRYVTERIVPILLLMKKSVPVPIVVLDMACAVPVLNTTGKMEVFQAV